MHVRSLFIAARNWRNWLSHAKIAPQPLATSQARCRGRYCAEPVAAGHPLHQSGPDLLGIIRAVTLTRGPADSGVCREALQGRHESLQGRMSRGPKLSLVACAATSLSP